ncbi:DEAD/DEAH box helicase [Winogradskyella sp.]|uniref:DEAD/DEAH box helicase n=1 Tax=Winogradskyella sp. TaxID=1883156 RepID=UPI003BAA7E54
MPFSHESELKKLSQPIQKWIAKQKWSQFRDIQRYAIEQLIDANSEEDLVLHANTAGGKTLAAFLPLLSKIYGDDGNTSDKGYAIIYIAPTRALINQFIDINHDLGRICRAPYLNDVEINGWMGEIPVAQKNRSWENPSGILIITPESFESILIRKTASQIEKAFSNVKAIIIDELHFYFDSPRGSQLISLCTRVDHIIKRKVMRIALSATLGDGSEKDIKQIHDFLRPHTVNTRPAFIDKSLKQVFKIHLSTSRLKKYISQDEANEEISRALDERFKKVCNGLIFTNSRSDSNIFTHKLRAQKGNLLRKDQLKKCIRVNEVEHIEPLINELWNKDREERHRYWSHFSSLNKAEREASEKRMRMGPGVLVATTTLELGIDVGTVNDVAQIGPGYSVASMRQRLGRAGRILSQNSNPNFYIYLKELENTDEKLLESFYFSTFQTIAQIVLLRDGKFESPEFNTLDLSTFVQQCLSLVYQNRFNGITKDELFEQLVKEGPFRDFDKKLFGAKNEITVFNAIINRLKKKHSPLLDEDEADGEIFLTALGRDKVLGTTFMTAFTVSSEYELRSESKSVGTISMRSNYAVGDIVIFAGKSYEILGIDHRRRVIESRYKVTKGRPAYFFGNAPSPSEAVINKMKTLYNYGSWTALKALIKETVNDCDAATLNNIETGFKIYKAQKFEYRGRAYSLQELNIVQYENDLVWFPWVGHDVLFGLSAVLRTFDKIVSIIGAVIIIQDTSIDVFLETLEAINDEFPETDKMIWNTVTGPVGKYDYYLTPSLWRKAKKTTLPSIAMLKHHFDQIHNAIKTF